jgi:hypothetical protein
MASRWAVGILSLALLLQPTAALSGSPETDQCGHVYELERARAALAQGNRDAALVHLQRADALLKGCEASQGATPPAVEGLRASALG